MRGGGTHLLGTQLWLGRQVCLYVRDILFATISTVAFDRVPMLGFASVEHRPNAATPQQLGFFRGVEVLVKFLGRKPILGFFFFYYHWKGAGKGCWVSLIGCLGRKLLKAYHSFYKHLKDNYFKVALKYDKLNFFPRCRRKGEVSHMLAVRAELPYGCRV